jgi:hypothetical protein
MTFGNIIISDIEGEKMKGIVVLVESDMRCYWNKVEGKTYRLLNLDYVVGVELERKWCVWKENGKIKQGTLVKHKDEILRLLKERCKYFGVSDEEFRKLCDEARRSNLYVIEDGGFMCIESYDKKKLRELCKKCNIKVINIDTLRKKLNQILRDDFGVIKMIYYVH